MEQDAGSATGSAGPTPSAGSRTRAWAGFTTGLDVVVILLASAIGLDAWADARATGVPGR